MNDEVSRTILMKYRKLDANGDYTFGQGAGEFYQNTPETVAQAIQTRLALLAGSVFWDTTAGVPYTTQIIGITNQQTRDLIFQQTILDTEGVTAIEQFNSTTNPATRVYSWQATVTTQYSADPLTVSG
jgi:hypothetical protein